MSVAVSCTVSMMPPKISILMAVYNAALYLRESIDSIRRQTLSDWELIAIDDGSTDDSLSILSHYAAADSRVRVISMSENGGQGKARNAGLRESRGRYVCFVDSDDCLAEDALEKVVERFERQQDADCVLFQLFFWYQDGTRESYPIAENYDEPGTTAFVDSLTWKIHGVYAVRSDIHQRYPYDTSSHAYSDDNTTRLHFLASRRVVATTAGYFYRQHPQSVTHRVDGHRFDYLLANRSMKRQLLELKVDDSLVTLYENERWKNLVDVYQFYYLHHNQLSSEERERGKRILHDTWKSIEVYRLSPIWRRKFGFMPLRGSWKVFCCMENIYFFLRGLLGKNKGK